MADIKIYSLVYWMRKGLAMDVSVIVGGIIPQSTGKAEALQQPQRNAFLPYFD